MIDQTYQQGRDGTNVTFYLFEVSRFDSPILSRPSNNITLGEGKRAVSVELDLIGAEVAVVSIHHLLRMPATHGFSH